MVTPPLGGARALREGQGNAGGVTLVKAGQPPIARPAVRQGEEKASEHFPGLATLGKRSGYKGGASKIKKAHRATPEQQSHPGVNTVPALLRTALINQKGNHYDSMLSRTLPVPA